MGEGSIRTLDGLLNLPPLPPHAVLLACVQVVAVHAIRVPALSFVSEYKQQLQSFPPTEPPKTMVALLPDDARMLMKETMSSALEKRKKDINDPL